MRNEDAKTYRIRASVGTDETVINVNLEQDYDTLEILSLDLSQEDAYKLYTSSYGVVVGRVLANDSFGIPNAKVSVFLAVENADIEDMVKRVLYPYRSVTTANDDNVRYNLLPDRSSDECHQVVGTFPNKRLVLDNNDVIEIYDKYWRYTTTTNNAGDYMIFGVPTGTQTIHVDLDMSDIGVLSQRPRDMIYKGYNINQFESPNQFKTSTNLDSLSQIYTQNTSVYVYPFWGDETENTIAVTRADVQIQYKFEPTCVFMGCVVTDSNGHAIGKNCVAYRNLGAMDSLVSGEGTIEMIRKTLNGTVEEFQVQGTRLIDGDGTWCYQIPMNLDYVGTDEYGNIVPTDDPNKGIPTRARVRFRISLDDTGTESSNKKRGKMLVPNNPRFTFNADHSINAIDDSQIDYEFGTNTKEDSYRDLFWNKVYTVKSYIPRLQRSRKAANKKFIGIKHCNEYGQNAPMPYNNLRVQLNLIFRLLCTLSKIVIYVIKIVNIVIGIFLCPILEIIQSIIDALCFKFFGIRPLCWAATPLKILLDKITPRCLTIPEGFCEDDKYVYAPGCLCDVMKDQTAEKWSQDYEEGDTTTEDGEPKQVRFSEAGLMDCVENQLAQENGVFNFDFYDDWVNGAVYLPLWLRKVRKKKKFLFGLIKRKAKVQYCSAEKKSTLRLYMPCAIALQADEDNHYLDENGSSVAPATRISNIKENQCHKEVSHNTGKRGVVMEKKTMLNQNVYYYRPVDGKNRLFATDLVLLGSLNDCDIDGLPQAFRYLEPTTFSIPPDMILTESGDDPEMTYDDTDGNENPEGTQVNNGEYTEMSGVDWGFRGNDQCGDWEPSGVFLGIYCNKSRTYAKSCVNLERVCELGVGLDERQEVLNRTAAAANGGNWADTEDGFPTLVLVPDGYISKDELQDTDVRGMLATMNINGLRTTKDERTGLLKYDLRYTYPNNFDGKLREMMMTGFESCPEFSKNYLLETFSDDYYRYRMGNNGYGMYVTGSEYRFPLYDNSFYFYFGIKDGNTALDKFNTQFFSVCASETAAPFNVTVNGTASQWCSADADGELTVTVGDVEYPCSITLSNDDDPRYDRSESDVYTNTTVFSGIGNGEYTVTVTDANGRSVSTVFNLQPEVLSFVADPTDFNYTYKELCDMVGCQDTIGTGCLRAVYDYCAGVRDPNSSNYTRGRIELSDLYIDGELVDMQSEQSRFKVEVWDVTHFAAGDDAGKLPENGWWAPDSNTYLIPTWRGNTSYQVKVTQLCDGRESNNTSVLNVFVSEPQELLFTINGVNYEYIKKFKGGYPNGDVYGWNDLDNYDVYNWPAEWLNPVGALADEFKTSADTIISQVKTQFVMECGYSKLALYSMNGEPAVIYKVSGVEETYNTAAQDYVLSGGVVTMEIQNISEFGVPTLVGLEDESAGRPLGNYGALNADKPPYRVALFTNSGSTGSPKRPIDADLNNPDNWFQVHFIDKRFRFNLVAWIMTSGMYRYGVSTDTYGFNGFVTGYIYNGKADSDHRLESATYTDSNGEEQDIDYETLDDEMAIPTRRRLRRSLPLDQPTQYDFNAQDTCPELEDDEDEALADCYECYINNQIDNTLVLHSDAEVCAEESLACDTSGVTTHVSTSASMTPTVYMAFRYTPGQSVAGFDDPFGNLAPDGSVETEIYYSGLTSADLWERKTEGPLGATGGVGTSYLVGGGDFELPVDWSNSSNTWFFVAITNNGERLISNVVDFNKIAMVMTVSALPALPGIGGSGYTGYTFEVTVDECENWYANNLPVTAAIQVMSPEGDEVLVETTVSAETINGVSLNMDISKELFDLMVYGEPSSGGTSGSTSGETSGSTGDQPSTMRALPRVTILDVMGTLTYCQVRTRVSWT